MKKTTLALACAAVLLASGAKKPAPPEQPVPVAVAKALKKAMPVTVSATGSVETIRTVTLTPQVDGQIQAIKIKEGQTVPSGALLMTIDPAPFLQALQRAQSALLQNQEQLKFLKIEEERYRLLLSSGAVSQEDYDTHKTNLEKMAAQISGDEAQVETAKTDLGYAQIHAPFSGQTGAFLVHEGAVVSKNSTQLLTLNQIAPVYVKLSIPEKHLGDVRKRQAAGRLKVTVTHQGETGTRHEGELTFIDNAVDQATGMIMLKATFPNKDHALWPGQFVDATLTLSTQKDAVAVPVAAVQSSQQGSFVYVVGPGQRAKMTPVVADRTVGDEVVVSKGLEGGETVVTDGQVRLREGSLVGVKASPAGR
ncbi:MAG TPA: efflux RND transporter periplasmic adaptor subunit [Elusimicrobia bacterium]|nr:efflux RND transporter periplasmic adaptor subunit [Elusimicrobiota bacterium]